MTESHDSCTSFCLKNDGYAVFGANYDHGEIHEGLVFTNNRGVSKSYWEADPLSQHAQWTSRFGSVTFNLVMNQFAWGGMNEAGLVISTMELVGSRSPTPDSRPWIYSNYWVQYILDTCETVEDVIRSQKQIRIKDYVDHYLVCDRRGNCVAVEFLDGEEIYHTGQNLPVKALANNSYAESIAAWELYKSQANPDKSFPADDPMLLRFILAAERSKAFKSTTVNSAVRYAFDLLDEVCGRKVNGSPTHWSIVYDTENFCISFKTSTIAAIRHIELEKLDFLRSSPVKMLDIHKKLSGDVVNQMMDYSSEIHYQHALHAGKKWGSSKTMIEKDIRYVESFL